MQKWSRSLLLYYLFFAVTGTLLPGLSLPKPCIAKPIPFHFYRNLDFIQKIPYLARSGTAKTSTTSIETQSSVASPSLPTTPPAFITITPTWSEKSYLPYQQLLQRKKSLYITHCYSLKQIRNLFNEARVAAMHGRTVKAITLLERCLLSPHAAKIAGELQELRGGLLLSLDIIKPAQKALYAAYFSPDLNISKEDIVLRLLDTHMEEGETDGFFGLMSEAIDLFPQSLHASLINILIESLDFFSLERYKESYLTIFEQLLSRSISPRLSSRFLRAVQPRVQKRDVPSIELQFLNLAIKKMGIHNLPPDLKSRFSTMNRGAQFQKGQSLYEDGDYQNAVVALKKVIELNHDSSFREEALFLLGYIHYFYLNDLKTAKWYLMQLNNQFSIGRQPMIALSLAMIFQEERKFKKSLKMLNLIKSRLDSLTTDKQAIFHFSYLNILMINGKKDEAHTYFNRIKNKQSFMSSPYFSLAKKSIQE